MKASMHPASLLIPRAWLGLLAALLLFAGASPARADTIRLTYDDTGADPAETFEEDCLGDTPADDCDTRAALIQGELVTLLSRLESDDDPETLALFQSALELDSPLVQAMAARYVSRAESQPDGFFSEVRAFFFGPDGPLGATASAVLQTSGDETDQKLGKLFDEQRPLSAYAPAPASDDLSDDHLLAACIADARLDRMESFSATEQFQPAERLLMYDRFVRAGFDFSQDYPVTAFVTDEKPDDVAAFFSQRFGEPYGPVAGSQERVVEISNELATLQAAAAGGDQQAIKKLQALVDELQKVQQVASLDVYLQLSSIHAENDLVWLDGDITQAATQAVRAVTVGEDDTLGQTVIRYINAPAGELGSGGAGSGAGEGQAGAPAEPGETPEAGAAGADDGRSTSKSDSGCGCQVPGAPLQGPPLWLGLLPAAWLLSRRRVRR